MSVSPVHTQSVCTGTHTNTNMGPEWLPEGYLPFQKPHFRLQMTAVAVLHPGDVGFYSSHKEHPTCSADIQEPGKVASPTLLPSTVSHLRTSSFLLIRSNDFQRSLTAPIDELSQEREANHEGCALCLCVFLESSANKENTLTLS